ncbi:glucosaminidase domain-containing protein [Enterococcus ureasiticus]|uniref:glucosaminidase domain-containing protein n=1 Tax=Enterococcus ureasiticus TaxID=903984 RepID=UPI001A8E6174|nr:glucosaminidase domain-containing protein [Enterococcus ureasiticus]
MKRFFKVLDPNAPTAVRLYSFFALFGSFTTILIVFSSAILMFMVMGMLSMQKPVTGSGNKFTGEYTKELPIFDEIKGTDKIPDDVAKFAVGSAVKYKLLPSVIISQWAYESEWGKSAAAKHDNNYFGITYFSGCPFPPGTQRGVGGSEGGWYMRFPDMESSFSYYGYMVAVQTNFNACVGNKSPGDSLLILGRGGYAAAGITESSPYYTSCMSIIESNNLVALYDSFAIERWDDEVGGTSTADGDASTPGVGDSAILDRLLGTSIYGGQCYGMTAYYVDQLGGPTMMGSGFMNASDIGTDYDWGKYGWIVIKNPSFSDFKAGDVINYKAFSAMGPTMYGHTGVIANTLPNGQYMTYEQNAGQGQIVAKYNRTDMPGVVSSIVRKVK